MKDLANKINRAFRRLETILNVEAADLLGDFIDPGVDDFAPDDFDIRPDDKIELRLPRCDDDGISITYKKFEDFVSEIEKAALTDNVECRTPERLLIRVENTGSYESYLKLCSMLKQPVLQRITMDDCEYEVFLDSGTTPFGFMVLKSGNWEKYFPPVVAEDLFVGIKWKGSPNEIMMKAIVDGLFFELASSHEIFLRRAPRPHVDLDSDEQDEEIQNIKFRPIIYGDGVAAATNLYSTSISTTEPEFQIIGIVKVLEHISATVVKADLDSAVRAKLNSSRALDPDADFISDLESTIITHTRQYRKDSDALNLTIQECCDATELANHAPKYLSLATVTLEAKEKERSNSLKEFASSLSATRNQIVHAKINYQ